MEDLHYLLQRYSDCNGATQGLLFRKVAPKPVFLCHTLEDEYRQVKLAHETRIWAAIYEMGINRNETPLTLSHRIAYNTKELGEWFKFHIEILGIKGFMSCYLHAGVDETHTDGCLLLMDAITNNTIDLHKQGSRSTLAVKRFYEELYPHLDKGGKAFLEIRDEQFLLKP